MIIVRKSEDRRYIDVKDQKTWMTFDAENKTDPAKNSFGVLKVLNEEILSPGGGFVLHTEKDMVVVTYVHEGVIIYKAPSEKPIVIGPQEFNKVAAKGDSKQYAFNTSESDDAQVFQCGFELDAPKSSFGGGDPETMGSKKLFTQAEREGVLRLIASSDGRDASLPIQQDVQIFSTFIRDGNHIIHELMPGRSAWLHVVKGKISLESFRLQTGDGAGLTGERSVSFRAERSAEILLFDLCGSGPDKTNKSLKGEPQAVEIS